MRSNRASSSHIQLLTLWLRCEIVGRKWILVVAVLFVLAVAWWVTLATLPHHTLNTLLQYEEKLGVREYPHGIRESR
jgi:hypothetical protein